MDSRDKIIEELGDLVERQAAQIERLTARISDLKLQLADETGIKDNGKKHWIWCIAAATFTVFHIATTRSREVLEKLLDRSQKFFSAWHRRDEMSEEGFPRSMIMHRDRFFN